MACANYHGSEKSKVLRKLRGRTGWFAPLFRSKVKSMQRSGTEAIRTQIQPSKPKREITEITNSQNTKRTYDQLSEQLFPKRWPLSNRNRTKNNINTHKDWYCRDAAQFVSRDIIVTYLTCKCHFTYKLYLSNTTWYGRCGSTCTFLKHHLPLSGVKILYQSHERCSPYKGGAVSHTRTQ